VFAGSSNFMTASRVTPGNLSCAPLKMIVVTSGLAISAFAIFERFWIVLFKVREKCYRHGELVAHLFDAK